MGARAASAWLLLLASAGSPASAWGAGNDLSDVVARAREQVESGAYAEALKTLQGLPASGIPAALVIEASLLETTSAIVVRGAEAGQATCVKAVIAAGYDPEVAREQSPKVRTACKAAALTERKLRLARANIELSQLDVEKPEVAWQPVRVSATASDAPSWLRVVARVTSSALEGSFDLALAPSLEGPLRGTLDPSWIRPKARISVELVAQDKFGDLEVSRKATNIDVPTAEALVVLGEVPIGSTVSVDSEVVKPEAGGHVPVAPGERTVRLELADGSAATARVEAKRGVVTRVALSPQKPSSSKTLAWIATGTAVAVGVAGGAMLISAANRVSEIEELAAKREPGSGLPATEYDDIRSRDEERKTFTTTGTGLLIAAGATGALALTLWLLPDGSSKESAAKKKAHHQRSAPALSARVGPGSLLISGRF